MSLAEATVEFQLTKPEVEEEPIIDIRSCRYTSPSYINYFMGKASVK